jgi:hypothetical protein
MALDTTSFGFQTSGGGADTNTQKFMIPLSFDMTMESNNDWSAWARTGGFNDALNSEDLATSLGNYRMPKNVPIIFAEPVIFKGFTCQVGIENTEITNVNLQMVKTDVFGTSYNAAALGSTVSVATSATNTGYELTKMDYDENFAVDEGLTFYFYPTGTLSTDRQIYVTITLAFTYQ